MSVNKALILGNLGANPELRYTSTQMAVVNLSVATSEKVKKADGTTSENTEWHTVVCFGKTAENCAKYLTKGKSVWVEGRIQTKKYQDKEGKDRYKTEIIANSVQFIGGAKSATDNEYEMSGSSMPAPTSPISDPISFDEDDIPF